MTVERGLEQYLRSKADAMGAAATALGSGDAARETIAAECSAADLTGVRRVRIRDFALVLGLGRRLRRLWPRAELA